jgi:asparagine synthase (glutamine-hydrolysing)
MCGIAGIYRPGGEPVPFRLLKAMTNAIAHRGPDGEGQFVDGPVGLGHRRLAILDLSAAGAQPMASPEGRVVVTYNGEIYNHLDLRRELESLGYHFRSRSDTEVLVHGYCAWGLDLVPRLNGMFAFALWDGRERSLHLARDRYGIKPLYYWYDGRELVFGSEIRTLLLHPAIRVDVDHDALNEYFTFQNLFQYHTLFKGISLLPAANIMTLAADGRLSRRCFWDFDFTAPDETLSRDEASERTLELFRRAVGRQMMADVPVGSYLSGGMDSGSIVAVASQHVPRLATFTAGFELSAVDGVEKTFDERREAELIANRFKTEHYEQVINAGDIAWVLPRVVSHLEDLRLGMSYPNYYITRLASKFVKVSLSGAGGDELYGGYPWRYYRASRALDREQYFREYYRFWQRLVPDAEKPSLFTEGTWKRVTQRDSFETFRRVFTFNDRLRYDTIEDHIANSLYFESKTFLAALFIVGDKLSMANSLEERFPFMDNDLVDFAQRIPVALKLGELGRIKRIDENELDKFWKYYRDYDDGKAVLRQAMSRLLPPEVTTRRKQGFSSPEESWYRGENAGYVRDILLSSRPAFRDFIRQDYVERVVREHTEQRINHRLLLWSLLCFEWWCRIFLDRQPVS